MGFGEYIAADATGKTSAAGVWVAGNGSDLSAGVTVAAGSGVAAAAAINADLVAEDTRLAGLPSLTSTPETPRQGITAAVIGRAAA